MLLCYGWGFCVETCRCVLLTIVSITVFFLPESLLWRGRVWVGGSWMNRWKCHHCIALCQSVCVSVCQSVRKCLRQWLNQQPVCQSVDLSICLSVFPSVCQSLRVPSRPRRCVLVDPSWHSLTGPAQPSQAQPNPTQLSSTCINAMQSRAEYAPPIGSATLESSITKLTLISIRQESPSR